MNAPRACNSRGKFKAGVRLEETVSASLNELGIIHRRTQPFGMEDVRDGLDFIVMPEGGRSGFEIQLTLRPKHYGKILRFASRALATTTRGVRLYVEVVASHHRSADLVAVGHRVAMAIREVIRRFRDFGEFNLLGVRIHAVTAKIEKFDLVGFCGRTLIQLASAWREGQRRLQDERRMRRVAALRERQKTPKPPPFWQTLIRPTIVLLRTHLDPTRPSPSIDIRPFFLPRRFC